MRKILMILGCATVALAARAQNWPSFRGPAASGVGEGSAPVSWDLKTSRNVKWKTPIPGLGLSSPIVWGGRVYVTSAISSAPQVEFPAGMNVDLKSAQDQSSQSWHLYCVDLKTGKILWDKVLYEGVPRSRRHQKNSFATPTAATDGKRIVAYFGSEGLFGLDMQGKVRWKQDLGVLRAGFYLDPKLEWGIASSPILYENLAIVQVDVDQDSFLAAFDADTGKPAWRVQRSDGASWSSPTAYRGKPRDELVTLSPKSIRSYDPRTGEELWHLAWKMDIMQSTAVPARGLIYVTAGKGSDQPVFAIRPGGSGDLTLPAEQTSSAQIAWALRRGGPITTSPLIYGDYLYSLIDQGVLQCFRADTGELVYRERLSYSFMASPVAAGGKLYLPAESGEILVVKAGPKYELLATNPMDEVILPTPAISGGMLVVRTQRNLYGLQ